MEARSREAITASMVFGLLALVIFSVGLDLRVENAASMAPGVIWVTTCFASILTLGRGFARERDQRTLEGMLLAPVDRSAIYLAKLAVNLLFVLATACVVVPAAIGVFNLRVDPIPLVAALLLGSVGFAALGTLFAAIAVHTRARELMLPLLLFPTQMPVVMATVKGIGAAILLPGVDQPEAAHWLGLLVAFDAIFLALSVVLFDYAIGDH